MRFSYEKLRFIFTSPTFVTEKTPKERKEFYISRLQREKSLYGTEFVVRFRNELKHKTVTKECADRMRRKVRFKSNTTRDDMNNFMLVSNGEGNLHLLPCEQASPQSIRSVSAETTSPTL